MARRKKRRLGHITQVENDKVGLALAEAKANCFRHHNKSVVRTCLDGVDFSARALVKRGFKP
jgi:hypothetical protein